MGSDQAVDTAQLRKALAGTTRVEREILEMIRQAQPVSRYRLNLSRRRDGIFWRLVEAGHLIEAGRGMLGTNWRVK